MTATIDVVRVLVSIPLTLSLEVPRLRVLNKCALEQAIDQPTQHGAFTRGCFLSSLSFRFGAVALFIAADRSWSHAWYLSVSRVRLVRLHIYAITIDGASTIYGRVFEQGPYTALCTHCLILTGPTEENGTLSTAEPRSKRP